MTAANYRQRAYRCFEEARQCHDVLIARMLDDLGREFETFAREIDASPDARPIPRGDRQPGRTGNRLRRGARAA